MKNTIKSKIINKFDDGLFGMCFIAGFLCVAGLALIHDEIGASFLATGLIVYPFIAAEKGFASFLLNGVLGEFTGVALALLMAVQNNTQGVTEFFFYRYLGMVAITISLGIAAFLIYKLMRGVSNKIKHINAN